VALEGLENFEEFRNFEDFKASKKFEDSMPGYFDC
jgi:hypothetical protein